MTHLASQVNKKASELLQHIEGAQKAYRKELFEQFKKEHPILREFEKLLIERKQISEFKTEQIG